MTRIGSLTTKIVGAYQQGEPILQIAKRLNIGQGSVWRTLKTQNIPRRRQGLRKGTITMPAKPEILGYVAGLFDGEGHLQFKSKHAGRSLGCKIGITNTVPAIHEWLLANVGGRVHWRTDRCVKYGWRPCGVWELYRAADVYRFLYALKDLLIIKRDAALAALELFNHFGLPLGY